MTVFVFLYFVLCFEMRFRIERQKIRWLQNQREKYKTERNNKYGGNYRLTQAKTSIKFQSAMILSQLF